MPVGRPGGTEDNVVRPIFFIFVWRCDDAPCRPRSLYTRPYCPVGNTQAAAGTGALQVQRRPATARLGQTRRRPLDEAKQSPQLAGRTLAGWAVPVAFIVTIAGWEHRGGECGRPHHEDLRQAGIRGRVPPGWELGGAVGDATQRECDVGNHCGLGGSGGRIAIAWGRGERGGQAWKKVDGGVVGALVWRAHVMVEW